MKKVMTANAPKALGPYSQAVMENEWIFVSGQLPIDLQTGKLIEGGIEQMTQKVIDHIEAILIEAGSSLSQVVRVEVFMTDLSNFQKMNGEYAKRFNGENPPARQTIQVSGLPMGSPLEISCISSRSSKKN